MSAPDPPSFPRSRAEYNELRTALERLGVTVKTPWREGLHSIRLGDIVDMEGDLRPDPQCACGLPRHHRGACQPVVYGEVDRLYDRAAFARDFGLRDER